MNGDYAGGFWWCSSAQTKSEATVFRAYAVPQGFVKILANQQRDGDSPIQNIVTGLGERSRECVMNGLRSFIDLDNQRAVEVGHLRRGLRPFKVKNRK